MPKDSNLHRRNGTYYARIYVPVDLVKAMSGKHEIWRSLRTKDYSEAKRKLREVTAQWTQIFDEMRSRRELTDADIEVAVWGHYQEGVAAGDAERLTRPSPEEIQAAEEKAIDGAIKSGVSEAGPAAAINHFTEYEIFANKATWEARRRESRLRRLRKDLKDGSTTLIEGDADAFLARNRIEIERRTPKYRELCLGLMRAEIEQLERYAERDVADFSGQPSDPIVKEPEHWPTASRTAGEGIMELFDKFEAENPRNTRKGTFGQTRRDVQHFADFVGSKVSASEIARRHVREWKELLAGYPVRASDTRAFDGLTLTEIVEANKALDKPKRTLTRQTCRRYLSSLSSFCRWLVANDYLAANPVEGMMPAKAPPTTPRATFTDDMLKTVFGSPLFTGCQGRSWREIGKPGKVRIRDHRYWIPWVMLYSGARPGEVAQLNVDDVREEHGIWVMHITTEGEGKKRTKTQGSMRVPESPETDLETMGRGFRGRRGRVLLRESVNVSAAGGPAPAQDWRPQSVSPDLEKSMSTETLEAARNAVCGAFGVLPAMFANNAQGPLVREAQRHLAQWQLQPIAAILAEEASDKLGSTVAIDTMRPLQAFDAGGRARALTAVVQALAQAKEAGVDPGQAFSLVDWKEE